MSTRLLPVLLALFVMTASNCAEDFASRDSIEPFYFLAGMGAGGEYLRSVDPSSCESFYKDGGEQRIANLFVELAGSWHRQRKQKGSTDYYFQPGGKRFVVADESLGMALRAFYGERIDEKPSVHSVEFDEDKRLSFVGGIYARCFHEGLFYGPPTPAMRATVFILLAEGCEVSNLVFRQNEVPNVMSFKVKPSARVNRLFALVDEWQPPSLEWKEK